MQVEVREQSARVNAPLPLCRPWGLNSGHPGTGPGVWIQVTRFDSQSLYLWSCLTSPVLTAFIWTVDLVFAGFMAFTISDFVRQPTSVAFLFPVSSLFTWVDTTEHVALRWHGTPLNQLQTQAKQRHQPWDSKELKMKSSPCSSLATQLSQIWFHASVSSSVKWE